MAAPSKPTTNATSDERSVSPPEGLTEREPRETSSERSIDSRLRELLSALDAAGTDASKLDDIAEEILDAMAVGFVCDDEKTEHDSSRSRIDLVLEANGVGCEEIRAALASQFLESRCA